MSDPSRFDAIPGFADNDEVVAHVIIYASSEVTTEYTDQLDHPEGLAWLRRRLDQAKETIGDLEARAANDDKTVVSERT